MIRDYQIKGEYVRVWSILGENGRNRLQKLQSLRWQPRMVIWNQKLVSGGGSLEGQKLPERSKTDLRKGFGIWEVKLDASLLFCLKAPN